MEIIAQKREQEMQIKHVRRIKAMTAFVDTKTPDSLGLKHLATRPKKQQLIDDRRQAIARDNKKLMENMAKILSETRIDMKPDPASAKLRSINEAQRKSQVEKLNFENRLIFNRLQTISPMIKKSEFQKDYEKNKAFHSRRKKYVPFGVNTSTAERSKPRSELHSTNQPDQLEEDTIDDPESESFLSQYRTMNNLNVNGNINDGETNDNSGIQNSDMPQSISEFRRQVISKKKLSQSSSTIVQNTKKSSTPNTPQNSEGNSKFIFTHDPN